MVAPGTPTSLEGIGRSLVQTPTPSDSATSVKSFLTSTTTRKVISVAVAAIAVAALIAGACAVGAHGLNIGLITTGSAILVVPFVVFGACLAFDKIKNKAAQDHYNKEVEQSQLKKDINALNAKKNMNVTYPELVAATAPGAVLPPHLRQGANGAPTIDELRIYKTEIHTLAQEIVAKLMNTTYATATDLQRSLVLNALINGCSVNLQGHLRNEVALLVRDRKLETVPVDLFTKDAAGVISNPATPFSFGNVQRTLRETETITGVSLDYETLKAHIANQGNQHPFGVRLRAEFDRANSELANLRTRRDNLTAETTTLISAKKAEVQMLTAELTTLLGTFETQLTALQGHADFLRLTAAGEAVAAAILSADPTALNTANASFTAIINGDIKGLYDQLKVTTTAIQEKYESINAANIELIKVAPSYAREQELKAQASILTRNGTKLTGFLGTTVVTGAFRMAHNDFNTIAPTGSPESLLSRAQAYLEIATSFMPLKAKIEAYSLAVPAPGPVTADGRTPAIAPFANFRLDLPAAQAALAIPSATQVAQLTDAGIVVATTAQARFEAERVAGHNQAEFDFYVHLDNVIFGGAHGANRPAGVPHTSHLVKDYFLGGTWMTTQQNKAAIIKLLRTGNPPVPGHHAATIPGILGAAAPAAAPQAPAAPQVPMAEIERINNARAILAGRLAGQPQAVIAAALAAVV